MKSIGKKAGSLVFWGILLAAALFLLNPLSAFAGPASDTALKGGGPVSSQTGSGETSASQTGVTVIEVQQESQAPTAPAVIETQAQTAAETAAAETAEISRRHSKQPPEGTHKTQNKIVFYVDNVKIRSL